jgi:DNA-binding transcriptional ArsR family regulator
MVAEPVAGDRTDVFAALADPTRRWMVERLARGGIATPTELAAERPITRQAVSRHLGVLAEGGLVTARRSGREHQYQLAVATLRGVTAWIGSIEAEWDERLAALGKLLDDSGQ